MNKRISLIFVVLFIVFLGLQVAEPVAAVKVVDKFTRYAPINSQDSGAKKVFTLYQYNKNYLKIKEVMRRWNPKTKKYGHPFVKWSAVIKKVSKTKLKISEWEACSGSYKEYIKTHLTAARYYWRVYRAYILKYYI